MDDALPDFADLDLAVAEVLASDGLSSATPSAPSSSSSSAAEFRHLWRRGTAPSSSGTSSQQAAEASRALSTVSATSGGDAVATASSQPRRRMTEDEKVEKHRMIVRRSYYLKKDMKSKLKAEIAALEEQYQQLVGDAAQLQLFHGAQHHRDRSSGSDTSDSDTSGEPARRVVVAPTIYHAVNASHCSTCAHVQRLRDQYKELSVLKEALLRQRDGLEDQIYEQQSFQHRLGLLLKRDLHADLSMKPASPALPSYPLREAAITIQTPEFPVSFNPLSEEECFAIIRRSFQDFRSQSSSSDFHEFGSSSIMGWNRKRTYGARASFSLLKKFSTQQAQNLWNQTWRLYTETKLFEQLYSGAVNMKFHILQRVNDNNVLFCRTLKTEKLKIRNVTIFLFARFQLEGKYFILFRSIDKDRIHSDHPEDAVLGMFSWMSFSDHAMPSEDDGAPTSHCEMEFGGTVPSTEVADTEFWMMEFLSYLLRLENRAIGPVFQVLHS